MKRKASALILVFSLILLCSPVSVFAQEVIDFSYENYRNGVRITAYNGSAETVVIPDEIEGKSVIAIGANAFYKADTVKSVVISENVSNIEAMAFGYCQKLESVTLPSYLYSIGTDAFRQCYALNNINTVNVYSIGANAFYYCKALESITFGNDTKMIGNLSFSKTGLTELEFNALSYTLNDGAFSDCDSLVKISAPLGCRLNLASSCFSNCDNLTEVYLDFVSFNGPNAFSSCKKLTTAVINSTVGSIPDMTFYNTAIEYIAIPEGCTSLSGMAFYKCDSLKTVVFPSTVKSINNFAFKDCPSLSDVYLPKALDNASSGILQNGSTNAAHVNIHGVSGSAAESVYTYNLSLFPNGNGEDYFSFIPIESGDLDNDGEISIFDYSIIKSMLMQYQNEFDADSVVAADVNGDSAIDAFDSFEVNKIINNCI